MITSTELFSRLRAYLKSRTSLRDLEGWLLPRLDMFTPDSYLTYVAATVHLCIIEIHDGIRTERSAKMFLRKHFAFHLATVPESWTGQQSATTNTALVVTWDAR